MKQVGLKIIREGESYSNNILYKIDQNRTLPVEEKHETDKDVVCLNYSILENQYGIFGYEYRSSNATSKQGWKTTDVLACIIDEKSQFIKSFILDIKKDISAFSDDLYKDGAVITAIKEVRDFIEQLHDENLHKNSFIIYYQDEGFSESVDFGIATRSFENDKFLNVAVFLESFKDMTKPENMQSLVWNKMRMNLLPYMNEKEKLRDFADEKVVISGKEYKLHVFLLEKRSEVEYAADIFLPLRD